MYRTICLMTLLLTLWAWAELPYEIRLPNPDARGDYAGDAFHSYWEVVDPDPQGLNGRRATAAGKKMDISGLPVVRRFPLGTVLLRTEVVRDVRNRTWFQVCPVDEWETQREFYLVRAHSDYLKPVYNPPPKLDSAGNYTSFSQHRFWKVVDPDPQGLNGRLHPNYPKDVNDARAVYPEESVDRWPVVARFPKGTILRAVHSHRGAVFDNGSGGEPWLLVTTVLKRERGNYQPPPYYFVRLHQDFLKPIY